LALHTQAACGILWSVHKPIFIIGAGGHAKSVAEIALAMGYEIKAFISQDSPIQTLLGFKIQPDLPQDLDLTKDFIAIGIGANWIREKVWLDLISTFPLTMFPALYTPLGVGGNRYANRGRQHYPPERVDWPVYDLGYFLHRQHLCECRSRLLNRGFRFHWSRCSYRRKCHSGGSSRPRHRFNHPTRDPDRLRLCFRGSCIRSPAN